MLFQRLFTLAWLIGCLALAVVAWHYQAPFSYEPVGPRAFPLLLLAIMAVALLYMLIRPTPPAESDEPAMDAAVLRKSVLCIVALLIYAGLFEPLGFIPSSALLALALARLYGGRWLHAVIAAVLTAVGLYLLFDKALDVPLPLGVLDFLER
jgi:putative tricarboxylic transport membrane protein